MDLKGEEVAIGESREEVPPAAVVELRMDRKGWSESPRGHADCAVEKNEI
jgi:hypothetical protein